MLLPKSFLLASLLFTGAFPLAASSPLDLVQEGLEAYLDERYDDSIRLFQQALSIDSRNDAAQKGLKSSQRQKQAQVDKIRAQEKPALASAREHMKRRDWVEALDRLNSVLSRVPDHPEAQKLHQEVRDKVTKLHRKSRPESSDWYFAKGVLAYIEGDWFRAADSWEQVYAFNPDLVHLVSRIDKAKKNLAEQQRQERLGLYQTVAWESLKKGDYDEAIRNWQELLALEPRNSQAQEGIRQARKAAEEEKARNRQEQVQRLSEQAMDAYIEKDYKKSKRLWSQVLEEDPENTLAVDYMKRMGQRGQMGDSAPLAQSGYDKAMEFLRDSRFTEAIEYLERHLDKHSDDTRAQSSLEEARARRKDLADKAYKDGLMAYSQGIPQEAIKLWQDALRVDPDYQRARQALIKAMAEQKK